MKKLIFLFCFMAEIMSLSAQTVYYWRNDQNAPLNASWSNSSPAYFWNGSAGAVPTGGEIIQFEGNSCAVSVNDLVATNRFKINFYTGSGTISRTLNGTTNNVFYDYGGQHPLIQNWSGMLQTINFPFQIGNESELNYAYGMHIWAGNGDLNLGSNISAANTTGGTKELVLTTSNLKKMTISGDITDGSGAIKLAKWGTGTLFLSGNNSYTGTTTISDGILQLGSTNALGSATGSTTVNTGYSLDLNGINYAIAEPLTTRGSGISSGGVVQNSNTNPATFPGLLTLASASTITGGAGTIALSNTGTITGAYDLTLDGASGGSIASIIGIGAGNLVKNGTGFWKLSAINTYTGQTQINNGELWIESGADINTASAIWLGNGGATITTTKLWISDMDGGTNFARNINVNAGNSGTRTIGGLNTSGTNTFSGNIIRSSNQPLTVDVPNSGGSLTLSGTINGSGEFKKIGNGKVTISGTNSGNFGGSAWNIEQGTMSFAFFGTNLNAKPIILGNSTDLGTVIYTGSGGGQTVPVSTNAGGGKLICSTTGHLSMTPVAQTQTIAGTFDVACNSTYNVTVAYIMNGAGGFKCSSTNTGILYLTRANTYSGTTSLNSGTLTLGIANAIPSGASGVQSAVTFNGGTLSTGAASAGFSCGTSTYPMGVLTVGASGGTIALAATTSTQNLYFANSSAATWSGGTLNITGWTGTAGSTGTNGHIFIGSDVTALTSAQLAKISFAGYTAGAQILSTGEIVPIQTSISTTMNTSTLGLSSATSLTVASAGTLTIDNNSTVNAITLAPGAKLTLGNGNTLTTTNGITLQSDATGTATILNSGTYTGTVTAQQYLGTARNWYVSSPVTSASSPATNVDYYYEYVEAGDNNPTGQPGSSTVYWKGLNNGTTMAVGKGYIAKANAGTTVSFSGTPNNGNITTAFNLTRNDAKGKGFNLVGNPYPSYIDWTSVAAANTNLENTYYYRTQNSSSAYTFVTWNGAGSSYVVSNGTLPVNTTITRFIPPTQAFWVRVKSGTSTTQMNFTNAMREHRDDNGNLMKARKQDTRASVRLQLINGTENDELLIYQDEAASNSYDAYDSPKMMNNSTTVPDLYTKSGDERLVINGLNTLSNNTELPLGFSLNAVATLKLKASELSNLPEGTKVYLRDKQENNETELTPATEYSFSTTTVTTNNESRFSLLFKTPGVTTDITNIDKERISVFVSTQNKITIIAKPNSNYSIYNAIGQLIENGTLKSELQTVNCKLQIGVYVVKVADVSKRVIIK